jgi:hypothetical protein
MINDTTMSLFYVGVLTSSADELESTEGRLLVFRVDDDFTRRTPSKLCLSLVAWAQVPGCIYALKGINGLMAAAVNASVCSLFGNNASTYMLKRL